MSKALEALCLPTDALLQLLHSSDLCRLALACKRTLVAASSHRALIDAILPVVNSPYVAARLAAARRPVLLAYALWHALDHAGAIADASDFDKAQETTPANYPGFRLLRVRERVGGGPVPSFPEFTIYVEVALDNGTMIAQTLPAPRGYDLDAHNVPGGPYSANRRDDEPVSTHTDLALVVMNLALDPACPLVDLGPEDVGDDPANPSYPDYEENRELFIDDIGHATISLVRCDGRVLTIYRGRVNCNPEDGPYQNEGPVGWLLWEGGFPYSVALDPARMAEEAADGEFDGETSPGCIDAVAVRVGAQLVASHNGEEDDDLKYDCTKVQLVCEPGIRFMVVKQLEWFDEPRNIPESETRFAGEPYLNGREYGLCANDVYRRLHVLGDWQ